MTLVFHHTHTASFTLPTLHPSALSLTPPLTHQVTSALLPYLPHRLVPQPSPGPLCTTSTHATFPLPTPLSASTVGQGILSPLCLSPQPELTALLHAASPPSPLPRLVLHPLPRHHSCHDLGLEVEALQVSTVLPLGSYSFALKTLLLSWTVAYEWHGLSPAKNVYVHWAITLGVVRREWGWEPSPPQRAGGGRWVQRTGTARCFSATAPN